LGELAAGAAFGGNGKAVNRRTELYETLDVSLQLGVADAVATGGTDGPLVQLHLELTSKQY
jgi:hypothetical protein